MIGHKLVGVHWQNQKIVVGEQSAHCLRCFSVKISIGDMGESHKPAATWTMKSSLINNGDPEFMAFEQNPGTQGVKFVLDPLHLDP